MDYDLQNTGTSEPLIGMVTSAQLAEALIKYKADITAIKEMRWIGQDCKSQEHCDVYYSCHAKRR